MAAKCGHLLDPRGERLILEMLYRELRDSAILAISFHPGLEALHTRKLVLGRVRESTIRTPAEKLSRNEPATSCAPHNP